MLIFASHRLRNRIMRMPATAVAMIMLASVLTGSHFFLLCCSTCIVSKRIFGRRFSVRQVLQWRGCRYRRNLRAGTFLKSFLSLFGGNSSTLARAAREFGIGQNRGGLRNQELPV
jgi:hypothetical protein